MSLRGRVGRHTHDGGRHCQNWPDDQQSVISLLNRIPVAAGGAAGSLSKPVISGICGDELYRAISTFEDKYFPGQRSGYLDPAGAMLKRMEELVAVAAAGPVDFVTPIAWLGPPNGPTKVISRTTLPLASNDVLSVGIAGDSNKVVKTVSADVPNAVTIEDAGVVGSGIHWFRLSRPRGHKVAIQAKDAKGTVVTSFSLDIINLPRASGPVDLVVDPADPKRPNTINLRVYAPKDDADYEGLRYACPGERSDTAGAGEGQRRHALCLLSRRRWRRDRANDLFCRDNASHHRNALGGASPPCGVCAARLGESCARHCRRNDLSRDPRPLPSRGLRGPRASTGRASATSRAARHDEVAQYCQRCAKQESAQDS